MTLDKKILTIKLYIALIISTFVYTIQGHLKILIFAF
jgi:hypothetical protein